jgi:hypothetical protein
VGAADRAGVVWTRSIIAINVSVCIFVIFILIVILLETFGCVNYCSGFCFFFAGWEDCRNLD